MTVNNETFKHLSDPKEIASEFETMFAEVGIQAARPTTDYSPWEIQYRRQLLLDNIVRVLIGAVGIILFFMALP